MLEVLKEIEVADYFTFLNAIFGLLAIHFVARENIDMAIVMVYLAVLMDGIDGFVARSFKKSLLGKNLDSLADIISFGICPALIVSTSGFFLIFISAFYVLAGIIRLARFNILDREDFVGCPITVSALLLISEVHIGVSTETLAVTAAILAFMMISDVNYPKIKNTTLLAIIGLIILVAIFIKIFAYLVTLSCLLYLIFPAFRKMGWCKDV